MIISFFSCSEKQKDLKLELLTNQIICVDDLKSYDYIETRYQPNKKYDSLSKNILRYKLTNNSDKKYFIMFNENSIGTLERDLYHEALGKKNFSPLNSLDFSLYKKHFRFRRLYHKTRNILRHYDRLRNAKRRISD